jgi:PAS domain S-box-containing protein
MAEASRLLRASTTGMIMLDKSGLINGVNPHAVDMLGADQAFLLKKPISLFIAPEDQSVFYINRSRVFSGDHNEPFEIKLKRQDGTIWSARVHAHPVERPNQRLPGMLLALEDISPYRQALESLQFKEDLIKLIFSVIDDLAVWPTADMDEIIIYCLEKVAMASGADRAYVCLFHDRKKRLTVTHEWLGDGTESPSAALQGAELASYAALLNQIKKRSSVAVDDMRGLAADSRQAHEGFHAKGSQSILCSPLFYGRFLLGIIGCDAVKQPVSWTPEAEQLIKSVGSAVVSALIRRRMEHAPTQIRETLLQFVTPAPQVLQDEPLEYEGPIEILENAPSPEAAEKDWLIEAGQPDDPSLAGTGLLKDGKTVNVACKNCNRQKLLQFSDIRLLGTQLKATCVCGNEMYIKIELRREHRKTVRLEGVFIRGPGDRIALKSDDWGRILITNLSRNGIGFKVFDKQDIRANDRFRVKFTLDNTASSVVQKAVVVRSVNDGIIGCEFTGQDPCDVTLGFYMMT